LGLVPDSKIADMRTFGHDGSDDDVVFKYLRAEGVSGGSVTDKLRKYFFDLGYTNQSLDDLMVNPGITVTVGATSYLLMENGDRILFENNDVARTEQ
jgi:hypothetical protein